MEQDPFFEDYRSHPLWIETATCLLDEPVEPAMGVELFNKPPKTNHETPPHQDNYYFCLVPAIFYVFLGTYIKSGREFFPYKSGPCKDFGKDPN